MLRNHLLTLSRFALALCGVSGQPTKKEKKHAKRERKSSMKQAKLAAKAASAKPASPKQALLPKLNSEEESRHGGTSSPMKMPGTLQEVPVYGL